MEITEDIYAQEEISDRVFRLEELARPNLLQAYMNYIASYFKDKAHMATYFRDDAASLFNLFCTAIKASGPGGDGELCVCIIDLLYIIFVDNRPHNLRKLLEGVSANSFRYIILAIPF